MTTRFFDFRKFAYKTKSEFDNLPSIPRKNNAKKNSTNPPSSNSNSTSSCDTTTRAATCTTAATAATASTSTTTSTASKNDSVIQREAADRTRAPSTHFSAASTTASSITNESLSSTPSFTSGATISHRISSHGKPNRFVRFRDKLKEIPHLNGKGDGCYGACMIVDSCKAVDAKHCSLSDRDIPSQAVNENDCHHNTICANTGSNIQESAVSSKDNKSDLLNEGSEGNQRSSDDSLLEESSTTGGVYTEGEEYERSSIATYEQETSINSFFKNGSVSEEFGKVEGGYEVDDENLKEGRHGSFDELSSPKIYVRKRLRRCLDESEGEGNGLEGDRKVARIEGEVKAVNIEGTSVVVEKDELVDGTDERALMELNECFRVSKEMTNAIVQSLGGESPHHSRCISESICNGRFNARRSYTTPDELLFPSKLSKSLKDYQKCGIQWLLTLHNCNRSGILADEMGLGKTAQTCVFLNYLYASDTTSAPSIIATPASLIDNWLKEIETWSPFLEGRVLKYHGKQADRRELVLDFLGRMEEPNKYFIFLTSINTLTSKWDAQYLKQIKPIAYLVVDEAHSLKNKDALVYRKLNKIVSCERRILLTGSPVQNSTMELRNLLLFVMPHVFKASSLDAALEIYARQECVEGALQSEKASSLPQSELETSRKTELMNSLTSYLNTRKNTQLPPDVECLQKILAPFILRRLKSEVLDDLPAKKSLVGRCEMSGRQWTMYVNEVNKKKSRLVDSLQNLTNLLRNNKGSKSELEGVEGGDVNEEAPGCLEEGVNETGIAVKSVEQDVEVDDLCKDGVISSNGGETEASEVKNDRDEGTPKSNQFVKSLLFRLRRICNHPLLSQGYYTNEQIEEIIDHYYLRVEGFMGNPRKKVEAEIRRWSDYEIHQGIKLLVNGNDKRLEKYLIPSEALLDSAKIKRMLELVEETYEKKEKALIFSRFTSYLNLIQECIEQHHPHIVMRRLDGTTSVAARQTIVDDFNTSPDITLFLLSTKAGGQGLNLAAACTVVLMDQDWNPHIDRQAEDRVHRLGQSKEVTIHRLCCRGTVEEAILNCCHKKLNLDEAFGGNADLLQAAILQESLELYKEHEKDAGR